VIHSLCVNQAMEDVPIERHNKPYFTETVLLNTWYLAMVSSTHSEDYLCFRSDDDFNNSVFLTLSPLRIPHSFSAQNFICFFSNPLS
jgi:hypothetical protein